MFVFNVFKSETEDWYPEEIVEREDIKVSLILYVQKFKNIL